MKKGILTALFLLLFHISHAQTKPNNRFGVGVSYITLDLPDDIAFLPKISYQYQLQKRLSFAADVGYLNYHGTENTFHLLPENRQRVTLDATAQFSLLKHKNNHLKIAVGPSLWYRNDRLISRIIFNNNSPNNQIQITRFEEKKWNNINLGYNLGVTLDIHLNKRVSTIANVQLINFKNAGTSSLLGLAIYYRFKK